MRAVPTTCLALILLGCSPDAPRHDPARLGFDPAELSSAATPKNDFFDYVNADWLAANPIPPERSSYGVMQQLQEQTEQQLREILERPAASDSDEARKIRDLYASFMDEARIESLRLAPLAEELASIEALPDHAAVMDYFGQALRIGVTVPLNFYVDGDANDPERSLAYIWQDGLGMPDRDYYLQADGKLAETRAKYREHIQRLHELAGIDNGAAITERILALETAIAEQQWTRVQNRDRERIYTSHYDLAGAAQLSPGFDWPGVLAAGGFGQPDRFVIAQTDYFAGLGELITDTPVADWRDYLRFKLIKAYAPYLHREILEEDFRFERQVLRGQPEQRPRWQRGIRLVNGAAGEMLGKEYVAEHFPPQAKAQVEALVANLREAFRQSINELDWMTEPTRAEALEKLRKFNAKIGYPDEWKDYSALAIDAEDLVGNVARAREWAHDREVAKLDKPVDRSEWGMTPQTINAYYRPTLNEIVFPAAILQPPFFDPEADPAVNYGAIGAVIGHEFSHGFDDQGRKFDGDGRLRDWWTEADAAEYQRRAQGLIEQYDAFQPLEDMHINGELTLGENIADLAGITMAHRAYLLSLDGEEAPTMGAFTGPHRFFIGYGQAWRTQYREALLREKLVAGPHSPARYRVNGVVRNLDAFHRAFAVKSVSGMWLEPEDRVRIW
jgi:predicted metalloendopeptidase